ncbi:MAG: hypothetical protein SXA11_01625 [Cyanobacteriota bacterium]|nr:hypothetical protein [Cyanobacteriota bacterium]
MLLFHLARFRSDKLSLISTPPQIETGSGPCGESDRPQGGIIGRAIAPRPHFNQAGVFFDREFCRTGRTACSTGGAIAPPPNY